MKVIDLQAKGQEGANKARYRIGGCLLSEFTKRFIWRVQSPAFVGMTARAAIDTLESLATNEIKANYEGHVRNRLLADLQLACAIAREE